MHRELSRRLFAECLGSAFLAAVVIGSGIMAQTLSPSDIGLELLENALATAMGLAAIILMFGPVSGAHFDPVVSLVDVSFGGMKWRHALAYIPAQIIGCILGAMAANAMFSRALISISTKHRASPAHFLSEIIATLGLMLVYILARTGPNADTNAPAAVGAYIGAALLLHQLHQLREPGDRGSDGCSPTHSPASPPAQSPRSSAPNSSAVSSRSSRSGSFTRTSQPNRQPTSSSHIVKKTRRASRRRHVNHRLARQTCQPRQSRGREDQSCDAHCFRVDHEAALTAPTVWAARLFVAAAVANGPICK